MNVLFYLGHPAHYHNVRHAADALVGHGHSVLMAARKKDVLLDLLDRGDHPYVVVSTRERGAGKVGLAVSILRREYRMWRLARRFRPDVMVGTDLVIAHVGRLLGIPSLVLNEDEAREVPLLAHLGFRFATHVLAPRVCDLGPYEARKVAYEGYHELAYLHPRYFTPDPARVASLRTGGERFFVLRLSRLDAHHDAGRMGIDDALAERLVGLLAPHGAVYLTSERPLPASLEPHRIRLHPVDIHHVLYYADLYVGDSQTMAAEAAVLGTPAVRFNDFVGRLGYLEELERVYGLAFGIPTSRPEALLDRVKALLEMPGLKTVWQERRARMLADKIDVTAFFVWFIENYPESLRRMEAGPEWARRFGGTPTAPSSEIIE